MRNSLLILVLIFGSCAQGAYLSSETHLHWLGGPGGVFFEGESREFGTTTAYVLVDQNYPYPPFPGGLYVYGYAQSWAQFGRTRTDTYAGASPFDAGLYVDAYASATASDSLTVLGLGSGYLDAHFSFYSSRSEYGWGIGSVSLGSRDYSTFPRDDFHLLVPIQFGVPVSLLMNTFGVSAGSSQLSAWGGGDLTLVDLRVFDGNMVPLSGYRYITESEAQYNFLGGAYGAVPEPSTLVLLGAGLGLVAYLRRTRLGQSQKM